MRIDDIFQATAAIFPEKVALITDGRRITFRELDEMSGRLASALVRRGVRRGDRVALFLPNGSAVVISMLAVWRAGAAFVAVNPQTKAVKLRRLLNDARPTCLIAYGPLAPAWRSAIEGAAEPAAVLVVDGDGDLGADERVRAFADVMSAETAPPADSGAIDLDAAAILYTSGSTGEPKGVVLTHANLRAAADSIVRYLGIRADDVLACALPLSFGYGLTHVLMSIVQGATLLLETSFAFPAAFLDTMARERATVFPGVPTMFATLLGLASLSRYDLRSLRVITNAAAALPEAHLQEIRRRFPAALLYSMYGQTECIRATYLPPADLDTRPGSVGRGIPNQEHWLQDDEGRTLPPGATGELVIRGSHVMRGYWEKPDETERKLRPGRHPVERVLHSGDLFRTDQDGYLYFVARKDDIIKSRGEKVSPREVEDVIYRLAEVAEAAVVGVPDPLLGEAVKAFVVLRPASVLSEKDIIRHCMAHLENFMVPKQVELRASLPRTSTGKIRKTDLKGG